MTIIHLLFDPFATVPLRIFYAIRPLRLTNPRIPAQPFRFSIHLKREQKNPVFHYVSIYNDYYTVFFYNYVVFYILCPYNAVLYTCTRLSAGSKANKYSFIAQWPLLACHRTALNKSSHSLGALHIVCWWQSDEHECENLSLTTHRAYRHPSLPCPTKCLLFSRSTGFLVPMLSVLWKQDT